MDKGNNFEILGNWSPQLLAADLDPVEFEACKKAYGKNDFLPNGILDEYMICAGGKSDSCVVS